MTKKPKKKPADPVVTFALLDADLLLLDFEKARRSSADKFRIEVPDGCDLAPGRYRWDATAGRFDPLAPKQPMTDEPPPNAMRAIWKGFCCLRDRGINLPPETMAWLDEYGKTIDAKG